jgi:SAM-dependent methyltransferase
VRPTDLKSPETVMLQQTLQDAGVHDGWESWYRSSRNEAFYDLVFERLTQIFSPREGPVLDAGCGPGAHSARLARAGYCVTAVDFSPAVVASARQNAQARGVADLVDVRRQDLLALDFPDASFPVVLCWGVLMHVAEIERALAELIRVLAPGGVLVLSEANHRSPDAVAYRLLYRVKHGERSVRSPAGRERWIDTDDGPLLMRQADVRWLIDECESAGLCLIERMAGQLTESYTYLPEGPAAVLHALNRFWFTSVHRPGLAMGNILVFRKPLSVGAS